MMPHRVVMAMSLKDDVCCFFYSLICCGACDLINVRQVPHFDSLHSAPSFISSDTVMKTIKKNRESIT